LFQFSGKRRADSSKEKAFLARLTQEQIEACFPETPLEDGGKNVFGVPRRIRGSYAAL
jgi:hypothetical protein